MKAPIATTVLVLAALAGIGVACSFPSPALVADIEDSTVKGDTTVSNDDSSVQDAASSDVIEEIRSDAFYAGDSALIYVDGGVDGSDSGFYNCDKDGDRVFAAGFPCGGLDCNDENKDVYPAENHPYSTNPPLGGPPPGNGGDWDCNGSVEKLYLTNIACGGLTNLNCAIPKGFTGDPACGTFGEFIRCTKNAFGFCVMDGAPIQQQQACK